MFSGKRRVNVAFKERRNGWSVDGCEVISQKKNINERIETCLLRIEDQGSHIAISSGFDLSNSVWVRHTGNNYVSFLL